MKRPTREQTVRFLKLAALSTVAGLATGLAVYLAHSLLIRRDPETLRAFYGAFFGALFAFGSLLLGLLVRRMYGRFLRNYDGLVRVQHHMNDAMDRILDNLHEVGAFTKTFKAATEDSDVTLLANRFIEIPTYPEVLLDLLNIDFINELGQFNIDVRKANDHMAILNRSHDAIQGAVLQRSIDPNRYKWNLKSMVGEVRKLEERLTKLDIDVKRLFASGQVLIRDKPLWIRIRREFVQSKYPPGFDADLVIKLRDLAADIEKNRTRRDRRAAEIQTEAAKKGPAA
jgi:hypothetical protein